MFVNDDLNNSMIRHQIYLERLKTSNVNDLVNFVEITFDDIVNKIKRLPENASQKRLTQLVSDFRNIGKKLNLDLYDNILSRLKELGEYETGFTERMFNSNIPVDLKYGQTTLSQITRVITSEPFQGRVLREWVNSIGQTAAERSKQQVFIGLAEGETVSQITKRMSFLEGMSKRDLSAVVRTSIAHSTNESRELFYEVNKDVIQGVVYSATLDGRTTAICRGRDGIFYKLGEKRPQLPAHVNCRSVYVPVVKSLSGAGLNPKNFPAATRASMNGQVPREETYNTWLRKQPISFVEETLGKTKSRLYLEGKVSLDRFIEPVSGMAFTLKELKKRESVIFEKLGINI